MMGGIDLWTLLWFSLLIGAVFGSLLIGGKGDDDERKHYPTRFTEAMAPYALGLSLLGMAVAGVGLLLESLSEN
jgi:hypothetical protein